MNKSRSKKKRNKDRRKKIGRKKIRKHGRELRTGRIGEVTNDKV